MRTPTRARLVVVLAALAVLLAGGSAEAQNGRLPASALSPIATGNGCNQLASGAAAGYNTMALDAGRVLPTNGCDSAYRTYARQVYWRNYWCSRGACGNAAVPGTSNHGLGRAVDVTPSTRSYIDSTGGRFGFSKACSDAAHEWWHVTFCRPFSRPNPGVNFNAPTLRKGSGGPAQHQWVRRAQERLRVHGFRVTTDGDFGKKTARAVRQFQCAVKLKPCDGIVGPATWARLRAKPKPKDPEPRPKPKPPATHGTPLGVDVSQHQPSINWKQVESQGYDFAIVKASEGGDYRDPKFTQERYDSIRKAKMARGVYHFLRPRGDRAGSVEADFFVKTIRNAGFSFGDIRPVVDIEQTTIPPASTCGYLRSFTRRVREQLDTKPIVYTYPSFAQSHLSSCGTWLGRHPLWIAHYGVQKPSVPPAWAKPGFAIWQNTSSGRVGGIPGDVDLNKIPGGQAVLDDLLYRKRTVTGGAKAP